jgi:sterol desaturase/sphingolipid hydroxylase (fatty acid hydroxylase superfamily)
MHMNFTWNSGRLEWIFVTPRYHHIHHSDNPEHYNTNMGSLFTFWDRLFGTYVNPDQVKANISFGTGEKHATVQMMIGV